MSPAAALSLTLALAYVAGATPFGYMAGKLKGVDIRAHGSGNIGATNVIRILGKGIGIPVFILDALKGLVPVCLAGWWFRQSPALAGSAPLAEVLAALGAVLGHSFTFWLGFRGGKGVATTAGAMLGLSPIVLLGGIAVWLLLFLTTRYVSLASMAAGLALCAGTAAQGHFTGHLNVPLLSLTAIIALLVIWRHRSNIQRLLAGTENKAGSRKKEAPQS